MPTAFVHRPKLLVALHDVAPRLQRQASALWSLCFAHGVRPALVIAASWRDAMTPDASRRFVDWLLSRVDQGAPLILRGMPDEGHIVGAVRSLRAHGLSPIGYMPSMGSARAETRRTAHEEGVRLVEDARFVWRLRDETPFAAPMVRWSVPPTPRGDHVIDVAEVRWRVQRNASLVRLALHPADADEPSRAAVMGPALVRWLEVATPMSYGDLLAGDRPTGSQRVVA